MAEGRVGFAPVYIYTIIPEALRKPVSGVSMKESPPKRMCSASMGAYGKCDTSPATKSGIVRSASGTRRKNYLPGDLQIDSADLAKRVERAAPNSGYESLTCLASGGKKASPLGMVVKPVSF
jgi:hypothetical protein